MLIVCTVRAAASQVPIHGRAGGGRRDDEGDAAKRPLRATILEAPVERDQLLVKLRERIVSFSASRMDKFRLACRRLFEDPSNATTFSTSQVE
jgi:hypothetical protein